MYARTYVHTYVTCGAGPEIQNLSASAQCQLPALPICWTAKSLQSDDQRGEAGDLIDGPGLRCTFVRNSSNMARIGVKLCQNAFRTISDVSFFDAEQKFLAKFSYEKFRFFVDSAWIWKIYGDTDVKISFRVEFCSR